MMNDFASIASKLEFQKVKQRLVHYATSDLGRQLAESITPETSVDKINLHLQKVSEVKQILESDDTFPIDGIRDIRSSIHRASMEGIAISAPDLRSILIVQKTTRSIRSYIQKRGIKYPLMSEVTSGLYVDKVLEFNIEQAIDEEGRVKDNASKTLHDIRRSMIAISSELRRKLEKIIKHAAADGLVQEEIITTREGRMVIPVKVEYKAQVPGFIHSASASGATVFIEPAESLELNNSIRNLQFEEQREIERILRELTRQVHELRDELLNNCSILAEIDFIYAKAQYSIETIAHQPIVKADGPIKIYEGRHPVLLQKHKRSEVIPLTLTLGENYVTLIITGPNAGGKSVTMKTVGILALMIQCGLHVPAAPHSEFPILTKILVDIGDEQSIENDLSTFSSHLQNLKNIVELADEQSLVLIDEIGAGTDPAEGGALAASILERLTARHALTIATTHHGSLKAFAHESENITNGAMEFDQITLQPTYHFKAGLPGSSYALEIARRMGLPEQIIARSREFIGTQKDKLEHLLSDLEMRSQQLQNELNDLRKERDDLQEAKNDYESRTQTLKKEMKELRRTAAEEAENIVHDANARIEKVIKELRESNATKDAIANAKQELSLAQYEAVKIRKSTIDSVEVEKKQKIEKGDRVVLRSTGTEGEVLEIIVDGKEAIVAVGTMKMRLSLYDLKKIENKSHKQHLVNTAIVEIPRELKREVDLRGMIGSEAIEVVDKVLDEAVVSGLHRVDIIHGKGTGALRKKIQEFLKTHPHVKSQRLGEWNEGSTGVTVVELKDE